MPAPALPTEGEGEAAGSDWLSLGPGHVTRLVGMPLGLAVVTEASIAALLLTVDFGTGGAARCHHSESAIGGGAPPRVGVSSEDPPQHQRLVQVDQRRVLTNQHLDVVRVKDLTALRTLEVDPALLYLYPDILLETRDTGVVVTVAQVGELLPRALAQTQGTLPEGPGVRAVAAPRRPLDTRGRAEVVPLPRDPAALALVVWSQDSPAPRISLASFPHSVFLL